jgi:hypothetical protein
MAIYLLIIWMAGMVLLLSVPLSDSISLAGIGGSGSLDGCVASSSA